MSKKYRHNQPVEESTVEDKPVEEVKTEPVIKEELKAEEWVCPLCQNNGGKNGLPCIECGL